MTPPTAKCAPALMRSFVGARSASPAYWPDSIANSAADSARLRAITELASCVLNSRCPTRGSSAMVRTMLAIPARDCSCGVAAATAAWVVAANIADDPIEDATDEVVLVGEAFVEVAGGQAGPSANFADGKPGDVLSAGSQHVQAGGQQQATAGGQPLAGLDAAVRPGARGLRHDHHLDTGVRYGQHQETAVLTISGPVRRGRRSR